MSRNTAFAAREIARELGGADLIEIKPSKNFPDKGVRKFLWGGKSALMGDEPQLEPYEFNADEYDLIVIGTPVWASSFTPPIRTFVNENRDALRNKKIAAFVCCSGGGADKALKKLKDFIGIDKYEAKLILIDPTQKPSQDKIRMMQAFAEYLNK